MGDDVRNAVTSAFLVSAIVNYYFAFHLLEIDDFLI